MITISPQITARSAPLLEYLKKQRENERLMRTFEIGTTFLFISFFSLAAIKPALTTISSLVGEIKSKELMTKSMKTKINQVIMAQDSFASIQEKYQLIDSSLPESPSYTQAMAQILGSAQDAGSTISRASFNIQPDENDGETKDQLTKAGANTYLKNYSISFSVPVDFSSSTKFLDNILKNRRVFSISNVALAPGENDNSKNTINPNALELRINLDTYYWEDSSNAKK